MVRQARCSGSGTKLKINSPATCRRSKRSASRKSCFRPLGARSENACAKCKRMYGSNSDQTGFQYSAVDSMTASFTPCSRSQVDKRPRSLVVVPKRRRSSSPLEPIASPSLDPTTTISTSLWTSIDAIFSAIVSSWRGSGRTRGEKVTHRHVLPPFPPGGVAPQKLVQNAHSGSNSATASTYPERRRPSPSHAGFIIQRRPDPIFMSIGGPKAHVTLSMTSLWLRPVVRAVLLCCLSSGAWTPRPGRPQWKSNGPVSFFIEPDGVGGEAE